MIIDGLPLLSAPIGTDEMAIERGTTTYKALVGDILGNNGVCRANLLDNWYFVGGGSQQGAGYFPINSKGQTSYSIPAARTNCIDRWFGYDGQGSGSIQIVSGGVKLTKTPNADGIYFGQTDVCEDLTGKTVTLSILTSTGALYSGTATVPKSNIISAYPNFSAGVTIESGKVLVQFYSFASSVTVVAAKLELGNTQTLAHQVNGAWVLNEVPNYEVEFYKSGAVDTAYVLDTAYCSKVGKVCVLTFDSSPSITTGNVDTWKALVTLPSKYRPAIRTYGVVGGGGYNSTYYCTVRIETTGVVSAVCHQAANVAYLAGQITYFTA